MFKLAHLKTAENNSREQSSVDTPPCTGPEDVTGTFLEEMAFSEGPNNVLNISQNIGIRPKMPSKLFPSII